MIDIDSVYDFADLCCVYHHPYGGKYASHQPEFDSQLLNFKSNSVSYLLCYVLYMLFFYSFSQHNGAMSSMTDFCDAFYTLGER
jgi:hypothetical protein